VATDLTITARWRNLVAVCSLTSRPSCSISSCQSRVDVLVQEDEHGRRTKSPIGAVASDGTLIRRVLEIKVATNGVPPDDSETMVNRSLQLEFRWFAASPANSV